VTQSRVVAWRPREYPRAAARAVCALGTQSARVDNTQRASAGGGTMHTFTDYEIGTLKYGEV
jgi:hypothetical protein